MYVWPGGRVYAGTALVGGQYLFVAGGASGTRRELNDVFRWNLITNLWTWLV
jgi:hypothetical protein